MVVEDTMVAEVIMVEETMAAMVVDMVAMVAMVVMVVMVVMAIIVATSQMTQNSI